MLQTKTPKQTSPHDLNFYDLDPNVILQCVEKNGFIPTGEILQLNSYENRVFDVRLEEKNHADLYSTQPTNLIAKFYRPARWSEKTLLDEHNFEIELKAEGLQVAAPYKLKNNSTVDSVGGIYYTFFEKVRGRLLQEIMPADFKKMGRWLAQLHNIGERRKALHRPTLGPTADDKWTLLETMYPAVAPEVREKYFDTAEEIFNSLDSMLKGASTIRIHGDLHRGNILESPEGFVVVDFDDFVNGPAIQDVWMLMPEEDFQGTVEFENLVQGYEELRHFPYEQLKMVPALRGYRQITYAGWILNRWNDPSFPKLFPEFGSYRYWAEQTENIQQALRFL